MIFLNVVCEFLSQETSWLKATSEDEQPAFIPSPEIIDSNPSIEIIDLTQSPPNEGQTIPMTPFFALIGAPKKNSSNQPVNPDDRFLKAYFVGGVKEFTELPYEFFYDNEFRLTIKKSDSYQYEYSDIYFEGMSKDNDYPYWSDIYPPPVTESKEEDKIIARNKARNIWFYTYSKHKNMIISKIIEDAIPTDIDKKIEQYTFVSELEKLRRKFIAMHLAPKVGKPVFPSFPVFENKKIMKRLEEFKSYYNELSLSKQNLGEIINKVERIQLRIFKFINT